MQLGMHGRLVLWQQNAAAIDVHVQDPPKYVLFTLWCGGLLHVLPQLQVPDLQAPAVDLVPAASCSGRDSSRCPS
jgi:hypothetical protein